MKILNWFKPLPWLLKISIVTLIAGLTFNILGAVVDPFFIYLSALCMLVSWACSSIQTYLSRSQERDTSP